MTSPTEDSGRESLRQRIAEAREDEKPRWMPRQPVPEQPPYPPSLDGVAEAMSTMRQRARETSRSAAAAHSDLEAASRRGKAVGYRLAADLIESLLVKSHCPHDWMAIRDEDDEVEEAAMCFYCERWVTFDA